METEGWRKNLLELFTACPLGSELDDCPSRELRKLAADDRVQIAAGVTRAVADRLFGYHEACLERRTGPFQSGVPGGTEALK